MESNGLAVVISGPSGAGKSTVCRRLAGMYDYSLSVSVTTRKPRESEEPGRDYDFVSRKVFDEMVRNGELLEHSEHFGNCYGTPRATVEAALRAGRVILLEIDVNGAEQLKAQLPDAVAVFLKAPSRAETERRLRGRRSEDETAIRTRLERAKMEESKAGATDEADGRVFDHVVVNDDLDAVAERIHRIITREASRRNGC